MIKIKILILLLIILTGCKNVQNSETYETKEIIEDTKIKTADTMKEVKENILVENITEENKIEEQLKNMTIEEKIGQMFILAFRKDEKDIPYTAMNEYISDTIKNYNIGGVILFSENIVSKEQTIKFINDMKEVSKIPMFIGVDEEGGLVSRIGKLYNENIQKASQVGATNDTKIAYYIGETLSVRLKELGFNLNFAPVADINSNPNNTVIGERSFGNDKDLVGKMVLAEVKGFEDNNILSVIKHFPGHGDTNDDTHNGSVYSSQTLERLFETEFVPFKMGIEAGASGVMVSHINLPNALENNEPAIFSDYLLKEILRKQFNFKGIIITDALDMKAITNFYSSEEACIKAIKAGVDIMLMPDNFEEAYNGILNAYKNNIITESEINEAVSRILLTKEKINN